MTSLSRIGEGNGNPLQYSCLENPRDRGACWAAVYGVAPSWTRLPRLSSSSKENSDVTGEVIKCVSEAISRYQTAWSEIVALPLISFVAQDWLV